METPAYLLGVDGGGTKTGLILVDAASGDVRARHTAPGCNPSHTGPERSHAIVREAIAALFAGAGLAPESVRLLATHLYMAGSAACWAEFAATLVQHGRVRSAPDWVPVLELATDGAPGLVLHAGTGSFVAARAPDGALHVAGGLGWKLGDPGSGFDLARRAVAHALLEMQGWEEPTALGTALREHTGFADAAANTRHFHLDDGANARLAAFAPRVVELAQQGVRPAQVALAATLTELVAQARLVTARLFPGATGVPCGVSGAILNAPVSVFTLQALAETHAWPVAYRFLAEPPVEGVRRLLLADRA